MSCLRNPRMKRSGTGHAGLDAWQSAGPEANRSSSQFEGSYPVGKCGPELLSISNKQFTEYARVIRESWASSGAIGVLFRHPCFPHPIDKVLKRLLRRVLIGAAMIVSPLSSSQVSARSRFRNGRLRF